MVNDVLLAIIIMIFFIALYIFAPKIAMLLSLFILTFVATSLLVYSILSSNCTDPIMLEKIQWLSYAMGIVVSSIITKKAAEAL